MDAYLTKSLWRLKNDFYDNVTMLSHCITVRQLEVYNEIVNGVNSRFSGKSRQNYKDVLNDRVMTSRCYLILCE